MSSWAICEMALSSHIAWRHTGVRTLMHILTDIDDSYYASGYNNDNTYEYWMPFNHGSIIIGVSITDITHPLCAKLLGETSTNIVAFSSISQSMRSMGSYKKDVTPLLTHWFGYTINSYWIPLIYWDIDGLVLERRNSIANALELRLSCTDPSRCSRWLRPMLMKGNGLFTLCRQYCGYWWYATSAS